MAAKPKPKLTPRQKRLRKPIVPGSTVTRGQLRKEAKQATAVKYGPLTQQQRTGVQEAKTYQRDIGTYYDDYLRHVQQSADRVREAGGRATTALQNLQGGVTGLAAADLTGIQQPANQDAAARGAQAGDIGQMASNATAVRQALLGSFGAQQARINQGAEDYATHKADVVAPSQRLQGLAMAQGRTRQARQNLGQTMRERGAYNQQYRAERRAEEGKNVLARQIAGVEAGQEAREFRETVRKNKASERIDQARIDADLTKASNSAAKSANKTVTEGAFAGYTQAQLDGFTTAQKRKLIRQHDNRKGGPGSKKNGGGSSLTTGQIAQGLGQLSQLKDLMSKAKAGKAFIKGHGAQPALGRYAGQDKVVRYAGTDIRHPALARAAADAVYDGHISAYTEQQLKRAGYPPRDVAQALGTSTHSQYTAGNRLRGHPR